MTSDHPRAGLHRATGFGGLSGRRKDSPLIMVAFAHSQIPLPRGDQSMDTRSRLVMRCSGSGANLGARLLRPIRTLLVGLVRTSQRLGAPKQSHADDAGRLVENYGSECGEFESLRIRQCSTSRSGLGLGCHLVVGQGVRLHTDPSRRLYAAVEPRRGSQMRA
jgi:hypothetical protein